MWSAGPTYAPATSDHPHRTIWKASTVARNEARIFATIWKDEHFRALPRSAQGQYLYLLSQSDLSYCGLIPLRVGRWARAAAGLTTDDVLTDLKTLAEAAPRPFIVVDEETEEVFVRSLIRRDEIWKQPNLMKAARDAARLIESSAIRAALVEELHRIPVEESNSAMVRKVLVDFLEDFGEAPRFPLDIPSGNPSPNPSGKGSGNPSDNPSRDPSANPSQGKGERGVVSSPSVDGDGPSFSSEASPSDGDQEADQEAGDEREPIREDVERLCAHLAEWVERNGSKRPNIGKTWRREARLLLDVDKRTERQVRNMIDWCQKDPFWHSRILSMPKLREKYDQMRLQASAQTARASPKAPGLPARDSYDPTKVLGNRKTS